MTRTQIFFTGFLTISLGLNVFLFFNGYVYQKSTSASEAPEDVGRYLDQYDPYIDDAKRRWSIRNEFSEDPFRNRTTSVVTLGDRVCVSFEYSQPDIGGPPPFYCYDFDSVRLIDKRDDVE